MNTQTPLKTVKPGADEGDRHTRAAGLMPAASGATPDWRRRMAMDSLRAPTRDTGHARRIVERVFRDYPGSLAVRLWDGATLHFGPAAPATTLVFHEPRSFRDLVLFADPLRLAEAYFRGRVNVDGDLYAALRLKDHLRALRLSVAEKLVFAAAALRLGGAHDVGNESVARWRWPFTARRARDAQRAAIAFHYDVSNEFYRQWLDEQMVYSCAYFEHAGDDLDAAQRHKLDYLCRKLRLQPGERLLDIGCGWGALLRWATRHYGVHAHGITLSRNQYDYARAKIAEEGLQDRATVELQDYRDLAGEARYDKIASVGMFEHVGLCNLPRYFDIARSLLAPGGLFLNHGVTHDQEGWRRSMGTRFINRYVFPGGELDTVSNVQRAMERSRFEILDVEALRPHYALTLRHWVQRLEERRTEVLRVVPESVYRVWRLYMTACALRFEEGSVGVYQILAAPRGPWPDAVPFTRQDLYRRAGNGARRGKEKTQ